MQQRALIAGLVLLAFSVTFVFVSGRVPRLKRDIAFMIWVFLFMFLTLALLVWMGWGAAARNLE